MTWAPTDSSQTYDGYGIGSPGVIGDTTHDTGEPFLFYRDSATRLLAASTAPAGNIYVKIELMTDPGSYGWTTKDISEAEWQTIEAPEHYYLWISNFFNTNDHIEQGSMWRITWNDLIFICTATSNSYPDMEVGTGYCLGNATMFSGTSGQGEPFFCVEYTLNPDLIVATTVSQRPTFSIEKWESQNGMNLISKTITTNGTYYPAEDHADGYSEITVNVSGNNYKWEILYNNPQQQINGSSGDAYLILSQFFQTHDPIAQGDVYRISWGNNTYICTAEEIVTVNGWTGYCLGNATLYDGTTGNNEPFAGMQMYTSQDFAFTTTDEPNQRIGLMIEKRVPAISNLITKTITQNGTYDPDDDNADGYSSVTVNVASASNWEVLFDDYVYVHSGSPNWISVDASTTHPIQGVSYSDYTYAFEANQTYRITWDGTTYICQTQQETSGQTYDGYFVGDINLINGATNTDQPFVLARESNSTLLGSTSSSVGNIPVKIELATGSGSSGGGDNALIIQFSQNATTGYWEPDKTIAEIQTAYNNGLDIALTSPADSYAIAGGFDGDVLDYNVYWYDYATDRTYFHYYIFDSNGVADDGGVELMRPPTGTKQISITENGTTIEDVTNYVNASITVNVPSSASNLQAKTNISPTTSSQTIQADSGYDGLSSVQINAMPTMTLPTSAASSATSGYTSKATISRSTSNQYINIPTGYNSTGGYYTISAVPNGSASGPASVSGTSATVSTGTNTLTLTKSVSITPTVSAGYVSTGTATNSSVSLTASITTKAAATITPSTSNQTIASGTYLTGTQTIAGDANLVGSNIISGKSIFGVAGTVTFQTYYTGSSTPASSLGNNGDIYLKT